MFVKQPRLHRVRATKFNLYLKEKDMISVLKHLFSETMINIIGKMSKQVLPVIMCMANILLLSVIQQNRKQTYLLIQYNNHINITVI